jgi:peroxiredoxin
MQMKILKFCAFVGLIAGVALLSGGPSEAAPSLTTVAKRAAAPTFTLKDSTGKELRLTDYRGKVVLLNFWATWCGPCKADIPWFAEFQKKYESTGLVVLGVSMDEDGWKVVRPYVDKMHMTYRVLLGDESVAAKYGGIESLPLTLMIDREGRIAARHVGLTTKSNFEQDIVELLQPH